MNIDKIVKECPKAFREWILYSSSVKDTFEIMNIGFSASNEIIITIAFPNGFTMDIKRYFRDLYDYFASVGIVVMLNTPLLRSNEFFIEEDYYRIYMGGKVDVEQEYRAFEKAFEIREQQLKEV